MGDRQGPYWTPQRISIMQRFFGRDAMGIIRTIEAGALPSRPASHGPTYADVLGIERAINAHNGLDIDALIDDVQKNRRDKADG